MKDQVIKFEALNQSLRKTSGFSTYPNGMVEIITAEFELGDEWDGYDSVRAVWQNGEVKISSFLDSNYKCKIPSEVLENKGTLEVNLVASSVDDGVLTERLTSYKAVAFQIPVKVNIDGSDPQDVTPSQFEQFVAVVKEDADRAEAGATDAEASAQSASGSATASANSATASATSADESEQSKTQAQEYAQNAYNSAVGAESAKDDAEDARDEIRSMRAEAVTLSPGSDATASYSDGLLSLGIPRGDKGETGATGATGPKGDTGERGPKGDKGDPGGVTQEDLSQAMTDKADVIINTASGSVASFSDGADDLPVQDLVVQIEPVQAGSGDPSPDNVRPITGWTGAKVTRTGKNLLEWVSDTNTIRGVTFTVNSDGTITANGTATGGDASFYSRKFPYDFNLKNGLYVLSGCPVGGSITTFMLNETKHSKKDTGNGVSLTAIDRKAIRLRVVIKDGYTANNLVFKPMIRLASDNDDSFEPYSGDTYGITFPTEAGTVYGGTLDVTNGVLTVDRAQIASYAGETLPSTWISDRDVYSAGATPTTGAQVVYELATPITYNLTASEIRTLLGQNNIWADAGDTSVTYKADTKLYIDKKFTELQALILEN